MKESTGHFIPNTIHHPDPAGKVAVVTGGSRGLGAATAQALATNGVSVAVVGKDQQAIDSTVESLAPAFPLGRLGQPGDIAAATLFLASSASSWITGVTLDIAGGKVML